MREEHGAELDDESPFERREYPAGETLQRRGEPVERVRVIREGRVLLEVVDATGERVSCSSRRAPSAVGLEALAREPAKTDAFVTADAVLLEGDAAEVDLWAASPQGSRRLLDLALDEQLRQQAERELMAGSAVTRLARFVLSRDEDEHLSGWVGAQLTEISCLLRMRPETLSRCVTELRLRRVLGDHDRLEIRDRRALERLATAD